MQGATPGAGDPESRIVSLPGKRRPSRQAREIWDSSRARPLNFANITAQENEFTKRHHYELRQSTGTNTSMIGKNTNNTQYGPCHMLVAKFPSSHLYPEEITQLHLSHVIANILIVVQASARNFGVAGSDRHVGLQ